MLTRKKIISIMSCRLPETILENFQHNFQYHMDIVFRHNIHRDFLCTVGYDRVRNLVP